MFISTMFCHNTRSTESMNSRKSLLFRFDQLLHNHQQWKLESIPEASYEHIRAAVTKYHTQVTTTTLMYFLIALRTKMRYMQDQFLLRAVNKGYTLSLPPLLTGSHHSHIFSTSSLQVQSFLPCNETHHIVLGYLLKTSF